MVDAPLHPHQSPSSLIKSVLRSIMVAQRHYTYNTLPAIPVGSR